MRKIIYVIIVLLFSTAGFFAGAVYGVLHRSPDASMNRWGEDCIRIDNQYPLKQEDYDTNGRSYGQRTLQPGYHSYCE